MGNWRGCYNSAELWCCWSKKSDCVEFSWRRSEVERCRRHWQAAQLARRLTNSSVTTTWSLCSRNAPTRELICPRGIHRYQLTRRSLNYLNQHRASYRSDAVHVTQPTVSDSQSTERNVILLTNKQINTNKNTVLYWRLCGLTNSPHC